MIPTRLLASGLMFAGLFGCGDDATTTSTTGGEGGRGDGGASASIGAATGTTTDASTGTGDATGAFSIMAWNVESFPKSQGAAEVVTTTIRAQLPTIAAFEEVQGVQLLEQSLDAVTDYALVAENDPPYALVAAVDTARASILDSGSIFTDDTYLFPRAPLVARIALTSGFQLDLVVVHQKAQVDEESEQRRRDANARLVAWCAQRIASGTTPIVLVGDFNDQVTDTGAEDVFGSFKASTDPTYWFLTANSEESGEYSYVPFRSFIDHQITTESMRTTHPNTQTAVLHLDAEVADYVSRVSDHRPVKVDFAP